MDEITAADIAAAALEPQSASNDGLSADARPLPDLIEADKYLSAKTAAANRRSAWRGAVTARGIPPGANGRTS